MKIHRRIIATGKEWKPCIECGKKFEQGEILTAIDSEGNAGVVYWYCEECTDKLFGYLIRKTWRQATWRLNRRGKREEIDWNGAA
jgi:hypothetical protein